MTKLKGIMINGEWLGERVIVNNCFRSICAISPIIMLETVKLINKIDYKKDVFEIRGFEFLTSDTIQIWFEGKKLKGIVDLTFGIKDSELFLKSSFLDIKPLNEKIADNSKQEKLFKLEKNEVIENNKDSKMEEIFDVLEKDIELEESHLTKDDLVDVIETVAIVEDCSALDDLYVVSEDENNESIEEKTNEDSNEISLAEELIKEDKPIVKELRKDFVQKNIVLDADTLLAKLEKYNVQEEQIENKQKETSIKEHSSEYIKENITEDDINEPQATLLLDNKKIPEEQAESIQIETNSEDKLKPEILLDEVSLNASEEKFVSENEPDFNDTSADISFEKSSIIEKDFDIISEDEIENIIDNDSKNNNIDIQDVDFIEKEPIESLHSELVATDVITSECTEKVVDDNAIISEAEEPQIVETNFEELNDANAEESLMDFYFTEEKEDYKDQETYIDELLEDDIVVQAMLSEVVALKEELDFLKNTSPNNNFKEAFWNERKNNNAQVIADEDADFKILSTNEKINAAILDNDSFLAGEKIYRWGDTLYLNE